jgi:hypothetical protein
VAEVPDGISPGPAEAREREKAGFVNAAIQRGMYFLRHVVRAVPASMAERGQIAAGADKWAEFIDDAAIHQGGRAAYIKLGGAPAAKFLAFVPDEIASRNLEFQKDRRIPMGWNDFLSDRALAFHRASEAVAASGTWADKAFIFYSKNHPTTGRVVISSGGVKDCDDNIVALIAPSNTIVDLVDGRAHPPPPSTVNGTVQMEQWANSEGRLFKRFWNLSAVQEDGDGTVPLCSLLGFGGPAKVFQPLPKDPQHAPAANSEWLWDRVIEVLEGFDVSNFLQRADTKKGLEIDSHLGNTP